VDRIGVGIVGTGFISRHLALAMPHHPRYAVRSVLTRRPPSDEIDHPNAGAVTRDLDAFLDAVAVVVECSGDPIHATDVIDEALRRDLPVVTMNAEFHVTVGSYFVGRGRLTEAEGDQPGCEAALAREAEAMGFRPLVYGNMKGFLNTDPTPEEMEYWGAKQGISLPMVTSFTDGTKVQVEQALVANGMGATIVRQGLLGPAEDDLRVAAAMLGSAAEEMGRPISDYVLSSQLPHGVFIVATHDEVQAPALEYLKMGPGPYYTLVRPNILVHLEIMKSVERLVERGEITLDNGADPEVSVAAIAKHDLEAGTPIPQAIGSFELRGEAVRIADEPEHVPIGLIQGAVLERDVPAGAIVTIADVSLPDSLAVRAWHELRARSSS